MKIQIPEAFQEVFQPPYQRYRVVHGGRGSAKSHTFAKMAILRAYQNKELILCGRELQNSIADSVHRLIKEQIEYLGLAAAFDVNQKSIKCLTTGSEFIFKGMRGNATEIKSTEGISLAWIEEAERVSENSWQVLIPTVRQPKSEIWVTFNPNEETAPTYKRFVLNQPPEAIVKEINYYDNPWFPQELRVEMEYMQKNDPDGYQHVWLGKCKKSSQAQVLHGKWILDCFDDPYEKYDCHGPYYGVDWGFSQDPTVMVRCFIKENTLLITHEAYRIGCELEELPDLFNEIPRNPKAKIRADCSRPETINFIKRKGFNIQPADKWSGSIEDGIAVLRSFDQIIIHERCRKTAQEARLYQYKIDRLTGDILAEIVDKNNHCWDAIRYALSPYIKAKMAKPAYATNIDVMGR